MVGPREALRALQSSGVAAALAQRHDLDLVLVFGSAVRADGPVPRDLDIAVGARADLDLLALLDDLYRITGSEGIDVLDLRRAGPVARFEALDGGTLLHEARPGLFASAHMAAVAQRADTAFLRRAQLEALAR